MQNQSSLPKETGDVKDADIARSHWMGENCHIRTNSGIIVAVIDRWALRSIAISRQEVGNATSSKKLNISLIATGPFSIQSSSLNGQGKYQQGRFVLVGTTDPIFTANDIIQAEIITESEAKNFVTKVGWGTAALIGLGTIFSGGLGLLGAGAAVLATGNNKRISFLATLSSGKQCIISTSDKIFLEIKATLL